MYLRSLIIFLKTFKNITRLGILLFGISLVLTSCQKDDEFELLPNESQTRANENFYNVVSKTYDEINKEARFSNAINKVFKDDSKEKGVSQRTVMEEEYGFTIGSGIVNEISYGNSVTYTMFVSREGKNPSFFENIIVSVDGNNVASAVLVKYNLNSEVLSTVHDNSFILDAEMEVTHINYNNTEAKILAEGDCVGVLMCPYGGSSHLAGQECIDAERTGDNALYLDTSGCNTGGDVGDPDDTNDPISSPGGSGHGSGSNSNTNPKPSVPVLDENGCITAIKGPLKNLTISYDEACWLNSSGSDVKTALEQYVVNGGENDFAEEIIDAFMNENYELNMDIDPLNSLNFNSISEFESFKNDIVLENGSLVVSAGGTHSTTFRVKKSLYTFIDIIVNQNLNNPSTTTQDYILNNVSTDLTGVTLATSWSQTTYDYTVVGDTAIIDLYGTVSYNIFLQSIGTIYNESVHYQIIIDVNTGQAISISAI